MSARPDRQFRFAIGLCPLWRAILRHHWRYDWSYNWTLDRTTDIRSRTTDVWILRHHRIAIHKDCLTDRNSTITGLIYRKTISRSDTPGQ